MQYQAMVRLPQNKVAVIQDLLDINDSAKRECGKQFNKWQSAYPHEQVFNVTFEDGSIAVYLLCLVGSNHMDVLEWQDGAGNRTVFEPEFELNDTEFFIGDNHYRISIKLEDG